MKLTLMSRLRSAVYGERSDLSNKVNRFNESVDEYSLNGSIKHLVRRGKKNDGEYGKIDNLHAYYDGNQLQRVEDNAIKLLYNGSMDFKDSGDSEVEYTYNDNGALTSDKNRGIALIEYDNSNNPRRVQFTNGNVTEYIYTATGQKLRTIHRTATSNITVPMGTTHTLTQNETQSIDSTDYLLGGTYRLTNGMRSMYLFPGGYCNLNDPTVTGTGNPGTDSISYHYYNKDHLGNNREVINESGTIEQVVHYYPFGTPFTDGSSTNIGLQPYLYGNKELDMMHGLNIYDFGARNYNPLLGQFTTMDRFCTKYFSVSPYSYCMGNPMSNIDVNGDSLFLSGKVEDINRLISVYEKGMGNLSLVSYDYNTGAVLMNTITEDQYASLSNSQKKVYSKLNEIINNSGVTKLNVTNNDNKVIIGLIGENTLDIGDILQFSNNKYISDVSMAIHETYENYLVQIEKMDVNNAHAKASRFETNITGFIIGLKRDLPNNGTGLLKIKIYDSQIPKNPLITTINVSLRRNNVKEIYND